MKTNLLALLFLAFFAASCQNAAETTTENKETTATEQKTDAGTTAVVSEVLAPNDFLAKLKASEGGQLIDVRTPEEVAAGALEGANNINFNDADFKEKMSKLDKSKPVFVYCKAGGRSGQAAAACKEMGFKEIYDMQGGWDNYSAKK